MKYSVSIGFDCEPLLPPILNGRELILLDTNALIDVSRAGEPEWIRKILFEWGKYGLKAVCGVCDFIRREAVSVENWLFGRVTVLGFLREIERGGGSAYVEVKTPVYNELADKRGLLIDLLPKGDRRIVISDGETSQTDKCLAVVAKYLSQLGQPTSIATADRALLRLSKALSIKTYDLSPLVSKP